MKKIFAFVLALLLTAVLFAGCGADAGKGEKNDTSGSISINLPDKDDREESKENDSIPEETASPEPSVEPTPDPEEALKEINAEAKEAFMAFLRGEGRAITSGAYLLPDEYGYFYNIPEGEYDCGALKEAVAELEYGEFYISYAFMDLGNDGKTDMLVRFDNYNPSLLNWIGAFCYEDGKIYLSSNWSDGYRSFSDLYTTGYLLYGGSGGAGIYISDLYDFNERAEKEVIYRSSWYYSSFAPHIFWNLCSDGKITDARREEYLSMFDDLYLSGMCLTECRRDGETFISCTDRAEDNEEVYGLEQKLLDLLSECGCRLISEDDMNLLLSFETDDEKLLEFTLWEFDEAKAGNIAG